MSCNARTRGTQAAPACCSSPRRTSLLTGRPRAGGASCECLVRVDLARAPAPAAQDARRGSLLHGRSSTDPAFPGVYSEKKLMSPIPTFILNPCRQLPHLFSRWLPVFDTARACQWKCYFFKSIEETRPAGRTERAVNSAARARLYHTAPSCVFVPKSPAARRRSSTRRQGTGAPGRRRGRSRS